LSKLAVVCVYVVMFIFILVLVKYIKLNYMEMKNFADLLKKYLFIKNVSCILFDIYFM